MSLSQEQLILNSPFIMVVEAKNENIIGGLGQCIAEMVGAKIFNESENETKISKIYGVVTTGIIWKFLKLDKINLYIDLDDYSIENPDKIMGILLEIVAQNA